MSPRRRHSTVKLNHDPEHRTATLSFQEPGKDWHKVLHEKMRDLDEAGCLSIHVLMPATSPLPVDFAGIMHASRLFFSGILLHDLGQWHLLYTCLQGHRFDFQALALDHQSAHKLRDHLMAEHDRLDEKK